MESRNWIYISHESLATAELAHRINCWRQNVEVCNTLVTDPTNNPSLQYPLPCEGLQTRPRNSRRRKPYTRPPDSPRQPRVPMDVSDLPIDVQQPGMSFLDTRQVWGAAERVVDANCGLSLTTVKGSAGLDLPHPEKNPLIAHHPDTLIEEYRRLAFLFEKLDAERRREEYRWVQTSSNDAMENIMELGSNIRRVVNAAEYVIEYSQYHGWDIDFVALAGGGGGGGQPPPAARVVPSRVRELVCSTDISNNRDPSADWHLYPAA